jgi:hypothetical protein
MQTLKPLIRRVAEGIILPPREDLMSRIGGGLDTWLELATLDRNGRRCNVRRIHSESYLIHFFNIWYVQSFATSMTDTDTGNVARTIIKYRQHMQVSYGAGATTGGIIVGTGTAAVTPTDYKLQTPIAHGTGAGQLSYGATAVGAPSNDSTKSWLNITRLLTNGSGSSITINEAGVYAICFDSGYNIRLFCIIRDLVPGGYTIPNGANTTATYKIQATA